MTDPTPTDPTPTDPAPAPADPAPAPAGPAPAPADPAPAPAGPAPADAEWRGKIEDDKLKTLAARYNTPADLTKALSDAQAKIRSGQIDKGLPADASEEEVAAYRTEMGVPEAPEGYELKLDEGLVLSGEDERVMAGVFKTAHTANLPASTMSSLTNALLQERAVEEERIQTQDRLEAQGTVQLLKDQWGADFDVNKNLTNAFLTGLPAEIKEQMESARLPDGRAMMNVPEILDYFASSQRQINPLATVVPNAGSDALKTVESKIVELESRMGTPEWYKDEPAQAEYRQLVTARDAATKK